MIHEKVSKFINVIFCLALGAALDNCLCLFFARRDSITIAGVPFVYDVVLVQCKK